MGSPARNGRVFTTRLRGVEVESGVSGDVSTTTYKTPLGVVQTVSRRSGTLAQGGIASALTVKHLITQPEDYPVVEYIIEHTDVEPCYDLYLAYEAEIGDRGVPLVAMGPDPIYRIMQDLVGYNDFFYHLADHKALVMRLYEVLLEQAAVVQQVALDSPARLLLHGEHFDSQFTPPRFFATYMLPYFQSFADQVHRRGKTLCCHADADTSRLLELILESGFDMAECFVTAPMVDVTLAEARKAWGDRIIIWGGIPSAMLCDPVSEEEFEAYMHSLFRIIAPGSAFILGVADNVMAETRFERIERISQMVETYGVCPIDSGSIPKAADNEQ
jgi:uroporphyrinogen-III decarboxylase